MSRTIDKTLAALASEFAAVRQINKKRFPNSLWKQAIFIAQQLSIAEVCRATKVPLAYFKKKMACLASQNEEQSMTFLELQTPKCHTITIHVQSLYGHKLSVEGITASDLNSILSEFLKGGATCCK